MKNTAVVARNKMWVTFCPKKAKKVIHILLKSTQKKYNFTKTKSCTSNLKQKNNFKTIDYEN